MATKLCPFCQESIQETAIKCRYCETMLVGSGQETAQTARTPRGQEAVAFSTQRGPVEPDGTAQSKPAFQPPNNPAAQVPQEAVSIVTGSPQRAADSNPQPTGACPHCGAASYLGATTCANCWKPIADMEVPAAAAAKAQSAAIAAPASELTVARSGVTPLKASVLAGTVGIFVWIVVAQTGEEASGGAAVPSKRLAEVSASERTTAEQAGPTGGAFAQLRWGAFADSPARTAIERSRLLDDIDVPILYYTLLQRPLELQEFAILSPAFGRAQNEFERQRVGQSFIEELTAKATSLMHASLSIKINDIRIGEYDFKRKGFPILLRSDKEKLRGFVSVPDGTASGLEHLGVVNMMASAHNRKYSTLHASIDFDNSEASALFSGFIPVENAAAEQLVKEFGRGEDVFEKAIAVKLGRLYTGYSTATGYIVFRATTATTGFISMEGTNWKPKEVHGEALHVVLTTPNGTVFGVRSAAEDAPADKHGPAGPATPPVETPTEVAGATRQEVPIVETDNCRGSTKQAKVIIIEYGDFECPYCRRATATIKRIHAAYGERVQVCFRHNPLPFHENAMLASEAALAAGEQGKFWEMHDMLFENQSELKRPSLEAYAATLGLDMDDFRDALNRMAHKGQLDADLQTAAQYGAKGTPTFFINGVSFVGAQSFDAFKAVIDRELGNPNLPTTDGAAHQRTTELSKLPGPAGTEWKTSLVRAFPHESPQGVPLIRKLLERLGEPEDEKGSPVSEVELKDMLADGRASEVYAEPLLKYATPEGKKIIKNEAKSFIKFFLAPKKVQAGVAFLREHADELNRIEQSYGVASKDIVSTLMWESNLGKSVGTFRVANVYLTQILFLDLAYERAISETEGLPDGFDEAAHLKRLERTKHRAVENLATLMRACKQKGTDILDIVGSWGGAVGFPQFMPTSFRWAVDGNADGRIDLYSFDDAMPSVANYLAEHGYKQDRTKAIHAYNPSDDYVRGVKLYADAIEQAAQ